MPAWMSVWTRSTTLSAVMSEADGRSRGGARGVSLSELERRAVLVASACRPSLQDQLDGATAWLEAGLGEDARLLFESVFIQQGFSWRLAAARRGLLTRLGLESSDPAARTPPPGRGNTVELAISELRAFAAATGPMIARSLADHAARTHKTPGLHPNAVLRRAVAAPSERAMSEVVATIFAWLHAPSPSASDDAAAEAMIDSLRGAGVETVRLGPAFAAASPAMLAAALALDGLRRFLLESSDLLLEPLGSTRLFHATASLDSAGLGPYLGNVGQIVRRSANLFELAAIAAEASATAGAPVGEEAWIVLLSRSFQGALLYEVVDDLGDRGAMFALGAILDRILAATPVDRLLVARLRDTALDNLDYALAARAQQAIVGLDPLDLLELNILGVIDASGGRTSAAEQSFLACLALTPEDEDEDENVRARLDAARLRRFEPYAVTQGFGSPHDRQLRRLRRRSAAGGQG